MDKAWVVISTLSLVYASLVTTALVIGYALFTRFERTQVGRQFMATKASLALILDYWAVNVIFLRPPTGYVSTMPARTIICLVVGTLMLRWLYIISNVQRNERRKRHPVWDAPEEPPPVRREP